MWVNCKTKLETGKENDDIQYPSLEIVSMVDSDASMYLGCRLIIIITPLSAKPPEGSTGFKSGSGKTICATIPKVLSGRRPHNKVNFVY